MTALTPATAARLSALADQLDAEAVERLPFGSGELAEALAQGNAIRRLAGRPGGGAGQEAEAEPPLPTPQRAPQPREVLDLMAALKASIAASGKGGA